MQLREVRVFGRKMVTFLFNLDRCFLRDLLFDFDKNLCATRVKLGECELMR